jgi:hypothetical protein
MEVGLTVVRIAVQPDRPVILHEHELQRLRRIGETVIPRESDRRASFADSSRERQVSEEPGLAVGI